jgi:hypothetical protein
MLVPRIANIPLSLLGGLTYSDGDDVPLLECIGLRGSGMLPIETLSLESHDGTIKLLRQNKEMKTKRRGENGGVENNAGCGGCTTV